MSRKLERELSRYLDGELPPERADALQRALAESDPLDLTGAVFGSTSVAMAMTGVHTTVFSEMLIGAVIGGVQREVRPSLPI